MITHTLDIEECYDFELIGISSHERDYRLAWALNRHMDWRMVREEDIAVEGKGGKTFYSRFFYVFPVDQTEITLIDNKTQDGLFLAEVQHFDYLLKINSGGEIQPDTFYKKLRKTPFVITAYPLDITKLKSRQNLLYGWEKEI